MVRSSSHHAYHNMIFCDFEKLADKNALAVMTYLGIKSIQEVLNANVVLSLFSLEALTLTFLVISDLLDSWASRTRKFKASKPICLKLRLTWRRKLASEVQAVNYVFTKKGDPIYTCLFVTHIYGLFWCANARL